MIRRVVRDRWIPGDVYRADCHDPDCGWTFLGPYTPDGCQDAARAHADENPGHRVVLRTPRREFESVAYEASA